MMEALDRLVEEYSECLNSIRQNMTKIIKRYHSGLRWFDL